MPRQFHLGDILTITTGRLVSPRHMDGVYDILNYMTGDTLFTHALPRASRECEEPLREMYPWLRAVTVPDEFEGKDQCRPMAGRAGRHLRRDVRRVPAATGRAHRHRPASRVADDSS